MTESVSPKTTSPYHSQIQSRTASPSYSSSIGIYVSSQNNQNIDHYYISNEKLQLQKLNDKFLSYIERVRLFETYNNCLTKYSEQIQLVQERVKIKLNEIENEFIAYQYERIDLENKDANFGNAKSNDIEQQIDNLKCKQDLFQRQHETYRKKIIDLQKKLIDLQSKIEQIRCDYGNINEDNDHYRKQISHYQMVKSLILDEISHQRDIQQRLRLEIEDLKIQNQLIVETHAADKQAMEIHNDNILCDMTTNFRFDNNEKNSLTKILNEIREEYKMKDNEMRDELHRKYLYEYNQHVKKRFDKTALETNREDIEQKHLANELDSLNNNRFLLKQKINLLQEHCQQLEINVQREIKRQNNVRDTYDQQILDLRSSIREYETLLNEKSLVQYSTLEDEVNKYRQLLEGSEKQIGLRQILGRSADIDQCSPNHRPITPVPRAPSPAPLSSTTPFIEKCEPISTFQILSLRSRQNSTSDISFATAPLSESSTNQQYHTLNSVNEKPFNNDVDTDNEQSQTIQYMSGRSSRISSETDTMSLIITPTNHETLSSLPKVDIINQDDTNIETSLNMSDMHIVIDQTLPFTPMNILLDEQQSPLISTVEKRENIDEAIILPSTETIIPITIEIDSKPIEETMISKIISPLTPTISTDEQSKSEISPVPSISDQPETTESTIVEVPISPLNPLAKLMSTMLPDVPEFVPNSNMNNEAPSFIPRQQNITNINTGNWNANNARGTGGNRRGQSSGGGFYHSAGGNQRGGGGGNWQQSGGHHKQRRGQR